MCSAMLQRRAGQLADVRHERLRIGGTRREKLGRARREHRVGAAEREPGRHR